MFHYVYTFEFTLGDGQGPRRMKIVATQDNMAWTEASLKTTAYNFQLRMLVLIVKERLANVNENIMKSLLEG